jgi:hypothetical protein
MIPYALPGLPTYGGRVSRRLRSRPPVYRITDARRSLSDDVRSREIRYLISMSIRTVCFVLAIVVPYWPLRVAFFIGALVLPYLAVVLANAGRENAEAITAKSVDSAGRPAIEPPIRSEDS